MIRLGESIKVKNLGVEGLLVYETRKTFWISSGRIKIVPKHGNIFEAHGKIYYGNNIEKRAWERLDS
ncbi:MAG: ribonuclease P protein subunit [Nitrososphaeria archaeon]